MPRITIIGLGVIGTSIGLALKASKVDLEIVGHDREPGRAGEARKAGALDRADWNLPSSLEGASLVVVATPFGAIEKVFSQIGEFLQPGCVVLDTASLKSPVIDWAHTHLADRAHFVGGHPIVSAPAGSAASATLFQGRTFCVVPSDRASNESVDQVVRLIQRLGATPLFLDATEHDSHAALVNQLPAVLSAVLMRSAVASPSWRDGQRLATGQFGDATNLALTDPAELQAQLIANRDIAAGWIDTMADELRSIAQTLRGRADDDLRVMLEQANSGRSAWQPGLGPEPDLPRPQIPGAREHLSAWLLGRRGPRRP